MKRNLILLLLSLVVLGVRAQTRYVNPILHLDYSDPDVCRVGEDYYCTFSHNTNFWNPTEELLQRRSQVSIARTAG